MEHAMGWVAGAAGAAARQPRPARRAIARLGIETAFRFASPANQVATGPIDRFAVMVKGPVYGDLLGFARADRGSIAVEGDRAAQRVTLTHADGRRAIYVFVLSRQDGGPCDGCWMTDAVTRRPLPESAPTRI